jgi:hypothetical protein
LAVTVFGGISSSLVRLVGIPGGGYVLGILDSSSSGLVGSTIRIAVLSPGLNTLGQTDDWWPVPIGQEVDDFQISASIRSQGDIATVSIFGAVALPRA